MSQAQRCKQWLSVLALVVTLAFAQSSVLAQSGDASPAPEVAQPVAPPVAPANPLKTRDELQAAYQREYAFLEAQLRDLRTRLNDFDTTSSQAEREKESLIDRIEGEYINLQSSGDRINDLLAEAERQVSTIEDSRSTLEATFLQAGSTLESLQIDAVKTESYLTAGDADKIDTLLTETRALLQRTGKWVEGQDRFFLADGTEVEGRIIRIGNIAAYGVSGEQGGALAPAGEGRLKVWSQSEPQTAQALAMGNVPDTLKIFLFESTQKAIEEKAGKTFTSVINSGGTIAWIIVALGMLATLLILLRVVFLRSASASTGRVSEVVGNLVRQGNLEQALKACKQLKGSTSRVVAAAVRNLDRDREHVEDIVSEQILHESAHLNRFGAFIMVIAAVAPLLGLLGTVTGMISTFDIITEFGTGDPKLLSGGISIALVTTEVGLAVAIPALIFGNLLSGWAESIKDEMEKAALHVMNLYLERPATSVAGA